jgi:hypothetical protein
MGLNLRFSLLNATATPFEHMNFIRNGNKRSSIESQNNGIAVMKYEQWSNVISTRSSWYHYFELTFKFFAPINIVEKLIKSIIIEHLKTKFLNKFLQ